MAEHSDAQIQEYKDAIEEMEDAAPLDLEQEEQIVNIEDLHLEDVTEDLLIEQFLSMGEALGVDTRQGSIYWDACMGSIIRMTTFVDWLSQVKEILSTATCTGEVLDEKLSERGLSRNPAEATPATYYVIFEGNVPELDSVMSCGDYLFILAQIDDRYAIISDDVGTELNDLAPGTEVIPEKDVDGLISATLGELAIPAEDMEDDDSARARLLKKLVGPDVNGNASQVRTWCESVAGVGAARIISLWNGPNTVKGVIVSTNGGVPASSVVQAVQDYIDPGEDGMGEGVGTIGLIFTAAAAQAVVIDVKVSVLLSSSGTYPGVEEEFRSSLEDYFRDMALADYSEGASIRKARAGALLDAIEDVVDYDEVYLNGEAANVPFSIEQVPVLGEVTIDGDIQ